MPDSPIPVELQNFILKHIDSIAQIEALMLLRRQAPEAWSVSSMAKRLYVPEQEALEILEHLCGDGLLNCEGELYYYGPKDAETGAMVDSLAETYAQSLIAVTNIIHSKPRRIRAFANAFKLRKDRG